jgi:hypothetical protein
MYRQKRRRRRKKKKKKKQDPERAESTLRELENPP